jgi:hypothetical protein
MPAELIESERGLCQVVILWSAVTCKVEMVLQARIASQAHFVSAIPL